MLSIHLDRLFGYLYVLPMSFQIGSPSYVDIRVKDILDVGVDGENKKRRNGNQNLFIDLSL